MNQPLALHILYTTLPYLIHISSRVPCGQADSGLESRHGLGAEARLSAWELVRVDAD
ncbi:predicted protein [Plenodomus lingam JN3]|uniref:Predicted protein n=1 Tax=Leptosphaeria maculans (strain JN3 / isolate v23.1.3 / race Av1-4-5-6-7-8) TaxID=985895 RepID=E4ZNL5_LEPMJ|nr:predicted protein [Plenodomus lingam JN3]CBX93074.1 predicted protein [Plenodomus lingam JN3]